MRDVALEKGEPYDPEHPDNVHRLNMGVFPAGAQIIPNPYNKIPGFTCATERGTVHFVPGFPVMAWPMIAWVLDHRYAEHHQVGAWMERSVVVLGAMEATLTDLDGFFTFVVGTKNGFGVVRDPIACKPAVMAETDQYVAFGSEYRALVNLPGIEDARVWEPEPATVYFWER
jgi:hypothetical protein